MAFKRVEESNQLFSVRTRGFYSSLRILAQVDDLICAHVDNPSFSASMPPWQYLSSPLLEVR